MTDQPEVPQGVTVFSEGVNRSAELTEEQVREQIDEYRDLLYQRGAGTVLVSSVNIGMNPIDGSWGVTPPKPHLWFPAAPPLDEQPPA